MVTSSPAVGAADGDADEDDAVAVVGDELDDEEDETSSALAGQFCLPNGCSATLATSG
jgi:hypothetical protein